ncbi:MAG: type I 3-dehydroquinate dehydratase [Candidatus Altiarchaeales archaeon ex4484_43]|nr:MAG: type I 3-dehydroquinate dehydratase [Candidatus Altiarchaeales archaeon ex4484_43]RLI88678.1 MAG: type I 3-dehydroquinate dehydratase [Candidatus Altiarchaeales archaeon]
MICASIIESGIGSMVNIANSIDSDIIELRLDCLSEFSGLEKLKDIRKEKIVTCMPSWEGGNFGGQEGERFEILNKAIGFAEFVTIELRAKKKYRDELIKRAKEIGVKVIIAYHDFDSTPERKEIMKILNRERDSRADIAKVAFMANDYKDVLNLMQVLVDKNLDEKFGIPIIALSMGKPGRISRVLAPLLGSYLTFASVERGRESAEGQLTVNELRKILKILG